MSWITNNFRCINHGERSIIRSFIIRPCPAYNIIIIYRFEVNSILFVLLLKIDVIIFKIKLSKNSEFPSIITSCSMDNSIKVDIKISESQHYKFALIIFIHTIIILIHPTSSVCLPCCSILFKLFLFFSILFIIDFFTFKFSSMAIWSRPLPFYSFIYLHTSVVAWMFA